MSPPVFRLAGSAALSLSFAACSEPEPRKSAPHETHAEPTDSGQVDSGEVADAVLPVVEGLAPALDLDDSPGVVEVELVASTATVSWVDDSDTEVWAYNGQVPGPLIQAHVGDTLRVHFTNDLDEPTTIHWHGLRISDQMDGVPAIQDPVEPGESFTYEFALPDAGTFWYHPHVRTNVAVEMGLQGMLVVHDPADVAVTERAFVVDDVLMQGTRIDPRTMDHMSQVHGRHGNMLLVNGETDLLTATVRAGTAERWRIVNTANARTMWVSVTNASWRVIAVDGTLLHTPFEVERGLLPVGQRLDLEVIPLDGAETVGLQVELPDGTGGFSEYPVFAGTVEGDQAAPGWTEWGAPALAEPRESLQEGTLLLNGEGGGTSVEWMINGEVYGEHTPLELDAHTPTVITIKDRSRAEHPFHLHGQFFRILDRNGEVLPEDAGLRDTVLVEGSDLLRLYTELENPGRWMAHCHILEHAELGMMTEMIVSE